MKRSPIIAVMRKKKNILVKINLTALTSFNGVKPLRILYTKVKM
jgi:hypothetical protein